MERNEFTICYKRNFQRNVVQAKLQMDFVQRSSKGLSYTPAYDVFFLVFSLKNRKISDQKWHATRADLYQYAK